MPWIEKDFFVDPLEERRPEEKTKPQKETVSQENISKIQEKFIQDINPLLQLDPKREPKRTEKPVNDSFTTFDTKTGAMDVVNNRFID